MADTPDYSESSSLPSFSMPKVSKLADPSTYYSSTAGGFGLALQSTVGQTATQVASSINLPNVATGLGTGSLGYATPPAMKSEVAGQDPLKDSRSTCWMPNMMSSVEQPSYHIRFYLVEDTPLPLGNYKTYKDYYNALQSLHQTTIAESGVTGLNISGMTIETLAAPNNVTKSMSALNMTLTIVEPMGVSFFDMIAEAAAELKIANFTKLYYYVDVKFIGYENGAPNMNICQDFKSNGGIWTYQVRIVDVAVDSNSAASTYTFTAMPFNEHIYDTSDLKLPVTFMPKGATVGQMLDDLAQMLNQNDLFMYGYNTKTYAFRTTPCRIDGTASDPSSWKVVPSDITLNYERAMAMGSIEGLDQSAPVKGTFPAGANINDVIETIIVASKEGQQFAKDVKEQDKVVKDDGKPRRCLVFRYEPTIEITGFDPITQQYIETITFDILSYVSLQAVADQSDVTNAQSSTNTSNQVEQAVNLTSAGYMCKRYDYMFTGLNTEVLNFDFKYKFNFEVALPRLYGYQNTHEAHADHAIMRPDRQDIQALQQQNQALVAKNATLQAQLAVAKQKEDAATAALATATTADAKTAAQSALTAAQAEEKNYSEQIATNTSTLTSTASIIGKAATSQGQSIDKLTSKVPTSRDLIKYAEDMIGQQDVPRYPIATKQSNESTPVTGKIPDSYSRDRSIYGSILDQLYLPVAESLLQINLSVRGDPYWLGTGNVERSIARAQAASGQVVRDHMAPNLISNQQVDFSYGDIMFLLTFKYPLTVADDGAPVLKNNESFTGIYRVISIKHEFQDGQFKQDITAVRCQLMDAFKALGVRVVEIPATDSVKDYETVSEQASAQAAATASRAGATSATTPTTTTSSSTMVPIPDAPAYSPLQPPLPPNMK